MGHPKLTYVRDDAIQDIEILAMWYDCFNPMEHTEAPWCITLTSSVYTVVLMRLVTCILYKWS